MNNPLQSKNGGEISLFKKKNSLWHISISFPTFIIHCFGFNGKCVTKMTETLKAASLSLTLLQLGLARHRHPSSSPFSPSLPPPLSFPLSPSARLSPNTEWLNYERQFPSPLKRKSSYSSCCCCSLAISRAKRASTATLTGIFQRNMNAVSLM